MAASKIQYYRKDFEWAKSQDTLVFLDFELHKNFDLYTDLLMKYKPNILGGNINKSTAWQPQVVMPYKDYNKIKENFKIPLELDEFLTVFIVDNYKKVPKGEIDLGRVLEHYSLLSQGFFGLI